MAVLTHPPLERLRAPGCAELRRVARDRVVVFSWDPALRRAHVARPEYFPQYTRDDVVGFPSLAEQAAALGRRRSRSCRSRRTAATASSSAFWRRPEAYLDPAVRAGISTLAKRSDDELAEGLARLRADLDSGAWARRHADLLERDELDLGYRLLVGPRRPVGTRAGRVLGSAEFCPCPREAACRSRSRHARRRVVPASRPPRRAAATSKPAAKSAASKPAAQARREPSRPPSARRPRSPRPSAPRRAGRSQAARPRPSRAGRGCGARDLTRCATRAQGRRAHRRPRAGGVDDAVKRGRMTRNDATSSRQSLL